jgi:murein DD-endopeptidase MepM/ murein hydrolase activator NlpD
MSTRSKVKILFHFNFIIFLLLFLPAPSLVTSRNISPPVFPPTTFPPEENNHRIQVMTPSGFKLLLEGRAFQPGEILLVQLEGIESIEQAWINGSGQKFYFFRKNSSPEIKGYAFLGLDGELEPGERSFELVIQKGDKSWEVTKFNLYLEGREYRKRKLKVASKYVEPPEEMRERIEREAEIIRVIFSMVTPDWLGDGPFIRPYSGPITAYFGDQRLYNNQRLSFHSGVDLAASRGDEVVAANSGQVALASDFYFSGKIVILDHGLGLFTTYHHLDRLTVRRGQRVKKGETIGLAGSSGLSTGPHLHWSARIGQSRIDPLSLLALSFPEKD